jgi:hypothetical protein
MVLELLAFYGSAVLVALGGGGGRNVVFIVGADVIGNGRKIPVFSGRGNMAFHPKAYGFSL